MWSTEERALRLLHYGKVAADDNGGRPVAVVGPTSSPPPALPPATTEMPPLDPTVQALFRMGHRCLVLYTTAHCHYCKEYMESFTPDVRRTVERDSPGWVVLQVDLTGLDAKERPSTVRTVPSLVAYHPGDGEGTRGRPCDVDRENGPEVVKFLASVDEECAAGGGDAVYGSTLSQIVLDGRTRDQRLREILDTMKLVQKHPELTDVITEQSTMKLFYGLVRLVLGHNWTLDVTGIFPDEQSMRTSIEEAVQLSTVIHAGLALAPASQLVTGLSPFGVVAAVTSLSAFAADQSAKLFSDAPIVFLWTAMFVILDSVSDTFDSDRSVRLYFCLKFFIEYDAEHIWNKNFPNKLEEFAAHKDELLKQILNKCYPEGMKYERADDELKRIKQDTAMKTLADALGTLLLFCQINDGSDPNTDLSVRELCIIIALLTAPEKSYTDQMDRFKKRFATITMTVDHESDDLSKQTTNNLVVSDTTQTFLWEAVDKDEGAAVNDTTTQIYSDLIGIAKKKTIFVSKKTWLGMLKFWNPNSVKTITVDDDSATKGYKVGIFGGRSGRMSRLGTSNILFDNAYFPSEKRKRIGSVTHRQALHFR